jgi:hypothetical protein
MNKLCVLGFLVAGGLGLCWPAAVPAAKPWEFLLPFRRAEVPPETSLQLTEDRGPWMILAASFAGPGAEDQAQQLARELRQRWKLEAFLHMQTYDYTQPVQGLGFNRYGGPKVMRYANGGKFDEIAVLVGQFSSIDDPLATKTLDRIKHAHPDCLDWKKNQKTTQRFIGLRELQRRLSPDDELREMGPMRNAFVTRNPLLPQEMFTPGGLDPLVERMNRDVEYSLLKNPGKYSVRVATFRGASTMKPEEIERAGKGLPSKLEEAAVKAHQLTVALRRQGLEAYEFHDRYESTVTVGSFEAIGRAGTDGRTELAPEVYQVMEQFKAKEQAVPGKNTVGWVPYTVQGIACDVQPIPVEVPQRSIGSVYAASHGSLE